MHLVLKQNLSAIFHALICKHFYIYWLVLWNYDPKKTLANRIISFAVIPDTARPFWKSVKSYMFYWHYNTIFYPDHILKRPMNMITMQDNWRLAWFFTRLLRCISSLSQSYTVMYTPSFAHHASRTQPKSQRHFVLRHFFQLSKLLKNKHERELRSLGKNVKLKAFCSKLTSCSYF